MLAGASARGPKYSPRRPTKYSRTRSEPEAPGMKRVRVEREENLEARRGYWEGC